MLKGKLPKIRNVEEERLASQLTSSCVRYERQYKFCGDRKWRSDFALLREKLLVEIEGGIWLRKGAHNTGVAITRDCEKYNAAALLGWAVMRFTTDMVRNGEAWKKILEYKNLKKRKEG